MGFGLFGQAVLKDDLAVRQYFVTGDITQAVFADDCRFKDPTNDIVGLARYVKVCQVGAHLGQAHKLQLKRFGKEDE